MDIATIAKILGPVLLKRTRLGKQALDLVNEILPDELSFHENVTGDEVEQELNRMPTHWRDAIVAQKIEDERALGKLKRELAVARVKDTIEHKKPKTPQGWLVAAISICFVIIALGVVGVYAYMTLQGNEGDAETLMKVLGFFADLLSKSQ